MTFSHDSVSSENLSPARFCLQNHPYWFLYSLFSDRGMLKYEISSLLQWLTLVTLDSTTAKSWFLKTYSFVLEDSKCLLSGTTLFQCKALIRHALSCAESWLWGGNCLGVAALPSWSLVPGHCIGFWCQAVSFSLWPAIMCAIVQLCTSIQGQKRWNSHFFLRPLAIETSHNDIWIFGFLPAQTLELVNVVAMKWWYVQVRKYECACSSCLHLYMIDLFRNNIQKFGRCCFWAILILWQHSSLFVPKTYKSGKGRKIWKSSSELFAASYVAMLQHC